MKVSTTKILVLTLVLGLAFVSLPNCVQAQNSDDMTLNFITATWTTSVLKPFFQEFEEKHGVEVEYEAYSYTELFETIEVRKETESNEVDVILVDAPLTGSYALKGYIKSLEPYFDQELIEETWTQSTYKAGFYNGEFYSAPLNNSSMVLYYNKKLLEEADVSFPPADTDKRLTWNKLVDAAEKVDQLGDDTWGFAFDSVNLYYQLQVLPESLGGGSGVYDDGKKVDITNDAWVEAMNWYQDLFNKWNISPKGASPNVLREWFQGGKIGFFLGPLYNFPRFNNSDLNFAVAPHPYFKEGKVATPTNSWHLGLWNYSQNEEMAAKFIKYLTTNTEVGITWLEQEGQFPARKEVLDYIEENEKYNKQPHIAYQIAAYEVENTAVVRAQTPGYYEFERTLQSTYEDIRNGADVEQTLRSAEDKISRLLRRYR